MKIFLTLVGLAVLALCVLGWLVRQAARAQTRQELPLPKAQPVLDESAQLLSDKERDAFTDKASEAQKDVNFRMQGERGMGGPVWGDVMCADGVYLPQVWESDMQTSFDGRWLRTGFYDSEVAQLVDRKSRRSWRLLPEEGQALESVHWRLPRWSGETLNESGMADDAHVVMSDASFEAWLQQHVTAPAQALVALRDIWVPADFVPAQAAEQPPRLATAPANTPAPELTLERHWPAALRHLDRPLEPLLRPNWQLLMGGSATPWLLDENHAMAWSEDGKALALYAYAAQNAASQLVLAVWSAELGWQQWSQCLPPDRKSWAVSISWPDEADESPQPLLSWAGRTVLQRVQLDTPQTERLHDGTGISCVMSAIDGCVAHGKDGRVQLQQIPFNRFYWIRDPARPELWRAQSEPLKGQPLIWTLSKPAKDELGETSAWSLQWGEKHFSGHWALEHLVVQGRWAVLMPHDRAPVRGGSGPIQIWDGERMQAVDLPWPVERMRPVPTENGGMAARVELVALVGSLQDQGWDASAGGWRWPVQSVSYSHLARADWRPVYLLASMAPDAQGQWRLLPRWREVRQIQHPCADGDYVWRDAARGDALWWWGGLNERINNDWSRDERRIDGVTLTRSGAVLCGTGPCACPHPAGEGWAVLELVESRYGRPDRWKLHWLNPVEKELRTLELAAHTPLLTGWDAQGLHWIEAQPQDDSEAGVQEPPQRQLISMPMWGQAEVEQLLHGMNGLWLRKQDLRHAEALLAHDWPWGK